MRDAGIPIWGEIELAYVLGKGDVLAITGTNGKTTTTALLGALMKNFRANIKTAMRVSTRWYLPRRFMKDSITEEYVQEIFEQYGLFGHHHGGNPCADDKMKP